MPIIGTAGHVDHGKSSLVRALTGTDPDRWIEEQLRGMTLDLGFALLRFGDGIEAGIVDVPGHERLVHNMLAGATGMDVLLLVVAANEGVREQTREHLAIMQFLNVRRTIVAITKIDLLEPQNRAVAYAAIGEALAGTIAAGAPAIGISVTSGEGLETLRRALHDVLRDLPPPTVQAPPFLPVDRAFALTGRGTIVTGTLVQGAIATGETLVLQPSGTPVRVRGAQVFGQAVARVESGMRVALNLADVGRDEIARGMVIAAPSVAVAHTFAVTFRAVPDEVATLKRRTPVRIAAGTAEVFGTLVFAELPSGAAPVTATLHLRAPIAWLPGQPFVARRMSPKDVLGGGTLTVPAGESAAAGDASQPSEFRAILAALDASGLAPLTAAEVAARANLREDRTVALLSEAVAEGTVRRLARPEAYLAASVVEALTARVAAFLHEREALLPWAMGATSLALARALSIDEALLSRMLAPVVDDGVLRYRAGYYASPAFTPQLTVEQRAFFENALPLRDDAPLVPANYSAFFAAVRGARIDGLAQAMETLLASRTLIKVGDHVYRGKQLAEIRARLERTLRAEQRITAARLRDVVGTSRKYIVPLLEFFDATGVTVRVGDERVLVDAQRR